MVENKPKPVCVISAAWNQAAKTLECLQSVYAQNYPAYDVILVDNGSEDNVATLASNEYPNVEIISLPQNQGFARGFNRGLSRALEREYAYIFLINNDTILAPDCLTTLVGFAESRPNAGLLTAKIYYAYDRKRIWSVGGRLHPRTLEIVAKGDDQLDEGQWDQATEVDFAPLCGVLLTQNMLETVGLLDEQFFVYYEDMDFCYRVRQAGYELWMIPEARIWHAVSTSSGGRDSPSERYWMAQGSGRYFRKYGKGGKLLLIFPFRLASALKTTVQLLLRSQARAAAAYWLGLIYGWTSGRATKPPPAWVK